MKIGIHQIEPGQRQTFDNIRWDPDPIRVDVDAFIAANPQNLAS